MAGGVLTCPGCGLDIIPSKGFGWGWFLLLFGVLYLIYWVVKPARECPSCQWKDIYSFNEIDVVAWRLGLAREEAHLSIHDVAKELGIDPKDVAAWEVGEFEPTTEQFKRLATIFGVDVDWLMEFAGAQDQDSASPGQLPDS